VDRLDPHVVAPVGRGLEAERGEHAIARTQESLSGVDDGGDEGAVLEISGGLGVHRHRHQRVARLTVAAEYVQQRFSWRRGRGLRILGVRGKRTQKECGEQERTDHRSARPKLIHEDPPVSLFASPRLRKVARAAIVVSTGGKDDRESLRRLCASVTPSGPSAPR
jgi:hypothetical protein